MASPHSMSNQSASFPPGLEAEAASTSNNKMKTKMIDEAANEMRAVAIESIKSQLNQLGDGDGKAVIATVRKLVLADVDTKVKEKAEELWLKGKDMLSSIQTKHNAKTQALAADLAECMKKQEAAEAENEKLKEVLGGLASRFQMLGAVLAAQKPGEMSAVASTMSPNQNSMVTELFSPASVTPGTTESKAADNGMPAKFAEVPPFPFPAPASPGPLQPSQPLSLAEHLSQSRQRLSLASSLTPPATPETKNGSGPPGLENASSAITFSFTLRKADGTDLGLNVSHHEHDRVLCVEGVRSEGAVEAWNRQCASSLFAEKAVLPGDTITSVNNIMFDPKKMLEECRDKQLLKIVIVRQRQPLGRPSTQLRAAASEFVPGAAATTASVSHDDAEKPAIAKAEDALETAPEAADTGAEAPTVEAAAEAEAAITV